MPRFKTSRVFFFINDEINIIEKEFVSDNGGDIYVSKMRRDSFMK